MSYLYKKKTDIELQRIADIILSEFPHCRSGIAIDIEAIIEELDVDVLARRGFRKDASAYLARSPRLIVIDESLYSYMPAARFKLAEEISHLILEYKLWSDGHIPFGASCHELSERQHTYIELDAKHLAAMLLMPAMAFECVFREKFQDLRNAGLPEAKALYGAREHCAREFEVSPEAVGRRALKLKIIGKGGYIPPR